MKLPCGKSVVDLCKEKAFFMKYQKGDLFYKTESGFLFTVPISECGETEFKFEEPRSMMFHRWIRPQYAAAIREMNPELYEKMCNCGATKLIADGKCGNCGMNAIPPIRPIYPDNCNCGGKLIIAGNKCGGCGKNVHPIPIRPTTPLPGFMNSETVDGFKGDHSSHD